MKYKDITILNQRKENLTKRLERKQWSQQALPLLRRKNIQYEMAEKVRAIECGGIGAFHLLACNSGLVKAINERVHLLKRHLPYHESDHVLNIAYNTLVGGTCLDDIELRRNDEAFMDGLGAERIPDPTTAGDFTRRFSEEDVIALMEAINSIRPKLWKKRLPRSQRDEAILDADGTHALTWASATIFRDFHRKGQYRIIEALGRFMTLIRFASILHGKKPRQVIHTIQGSSINNKDLPCNVRAFIRS